MNRELFDKISGDRKIIIIIINQMNGLLIYSINSSGEEDDEDENEDDDDNSNISIISLKPLSRCYQGFFHSIIQKNTPKPRRNDGESF